jgi:hypothetical protein
VTTRTILYSWKNIVTTVGMDEAGSGPSVVLLPALSSISTRAEMRPLFETLAPEFRVSTVDWPGFGDLVRVRTDWSPAILSAFLDWFLSEIVAPPHIVVAAGHAASYALYQAAYRHGTIERLVLIAPTWRGPLPTMMGGQRPWFAHVRVGVDHWVIGPLLYRLNMSRFVVTRMAREHVYEDPGWLSGDRLSAKLVVTRTPGARHASVRFVSGALDRVESRAAFLDLARRASDRTGFGGSNGFLPGRQPLRGCAQCPAPSGESDAAPGRGTSGEPCGTFIHGGTLCTSRCLLLDAARLLPGVPGHEP